MLDLYETTQELPSETRLPNNFNLAQTCRISCTLVTQIISDPSVHSQIISDPSDSKFVHLLTRIPLMHATY